MDLYTLEEYKTNVLVHPKVPLYHANYAYALAEHGKRDEAIIEYEKALGLEEEKQLQPNHRAWIRYSLGVLFNEKGNLPRAYALFRQAFYIDPSDALNRIELKKTVKEMKELGELADSTLDSHNKTL